MTASIPGHVVTKVKESPPTTRKNNIWPQQRSGHVSRENSPDAAGRRTLVLNVIIVTELSDA